MVAQHPLSCLRADDLSLAAHDWSAERDGSSACIIWLAKDAPTMGTFQEVVMDVARIAILVSCLCACSPTKPAAIPPNTQGPAPSALVAVPRFGEWANWSHEKKLEYMRATVEVTEKALFTRYDPLRYANFTCKTCHGSGALNGTFRMPNPELPKWPGGPDAFKKLLERDPRMLKFMQQVIVPVTARLIGVQEFDFATHSGFSCFQCHVRSEPPPTEKNG
jgi:hypothetical protein